MRERITKAQKRELLDQEMARFLAKGGEVLEVEQGISGRENPMQAMMPILFNEKALSRTDARPALCQLDSRKNLNSKKPNPVTPKIRRKKIAVYDDFGEVLRWVWNDE